LIIDFHTHALPDEIEVKVTESLKARYKVQKLYPSTIGSLLKIISEAKVDMAVVQLFSNSPNNVCYLNNWGADVARRFMPRITCFGTVHPDMHDVDGELERIVKFGFKGLKLQPTAQRFVPDEPRLFRIYEKACELRLPILFHAGEERAPMDRVYAHPKSFIQVLSSLPNLTVVLAHLGGFRMWRHVAPLADFKNAYFDTSAATSELSAKELKDLIGLLDADHVLFGSDFPWFDYNQSLNMIKELDIPLEDKEKILWRNAAKILGM